MPTKSRALIWTAPSPYPPLPPYLYLSRVLSPLSTCSQRTMRWISDNKWRPSAWQKEQHYKNRTSIIIVRSNHNFSTLRMTPPELNMRLMPARSRQSSAHPQNQVRYTSKYCIVFFIFLSHSFSRNQEDILATTSATLRSLCGWDRGQHGDVALFLVGAFQDEKKKLKLFKCVLLYSSRLLRFLSTLNSVSIADNPNVSDFTSMLSDFKKDVRAPFKAWATSVLPGMICTYLIMFYVLILVLSRRNK